MKNLLSLAALAAAMLALGPVRAQAPGVTATTIIIGQSAPLTGANEIGRAHV